MPFQLPENFDISTVPNFQELANGAIGTPETGFAPNPALPRVTDAERAEHERIFREQANAADNLKDALKVANKYVEAAVLGTRLGKSLIQYQTGIQEIRTAKVEFAKAQTRTEIALAEHDQLRLKLNHEVAMIPTIERELVNKLRLQESKANNALLAAMDHEHQTAQKYQLVDVDAQTIRPAA